MSVSLSRTSKLKVYIPEITAFAAGSGEADVTTLPVQVSLLAEGTFPVETDWTTATWLAGATTPTAWFLLSGPNKGGAIERAPGEWTLWLRVKGAVEQPEEPVGLVIIN